MQCSSPDLRDDALVVLLLVVVESRLYCAAIPGDLECRAKMCWCSGEEAHHSRRTSHIQGAGGTTNELPVRSHEHHGILHTCQR